MAADAPARVTVRPTERGDRWWLARTGLSLEHAGTRYHWAELPLQLVIAPMRALDVPRGPSYIVEVEHRAAGYIGRNPLSGNLEYWLEPWARGGGAGTAAIAAFLRAWATTADRPRKFSIAAGNERSKGALLAAFDAVEWREGEQYTVQRTRHGWAVMADPFAGA